MIGAGGFSWDGGAGVCMGGGGVGGLERTRPGFSSDRDRG